MFSYYGLLPKHKRKRSNFKLSTDTEILNKTLFVKSSQRNNFEQHLTKVTDDSIGYRKASTVKKNILREFIYSDLFKFKGRAKRIVDFGDAKYPNKYLEIKLFKLSKTYIYVHVDSNDQIELRQRVLNK